MAGPTVLHVDPKVRWMAFWGLAPKWWEFRFWLPKPPDGEVVEIPVTEYERMLLHKLTRANGDPSQAIWELAHFYKN